MIQEPDAVPEEGIKPDPCVRPQQDTHTHMFNVAILYRICKFNFNNGKTANKLDQSNTGKLLLLIL